MIGKATTRTNSIEQIPFQLGSEQGHFVRTDLPTGRVQGSKRPILSFLPIHQNTTIRLQGSLNDCQE